MINTIDDLIIDLQALKIKHGNIFVRNQTQIGKAININYYVDKFYNEDKTVYLEVLVIKGYVDK